MSINGGVFRGAHRARTMAPMPTDEPLTPANGADPAASPVTSAPSSGGDQLGMVVGGSLTKGIDVRLEGGVPIEEVSVGRFVTIQAERRRFFGVVTDISLGQTDPAMVLTPPDVDDDFIRAVVSGANAFGLVHVVPYLTQTGAAGLDDGPLPAKTVPPHFAPARYSAAAGDRGDLRRERQGPPLGGQPA